MLSSLIATASTFIPASRLDFEELRQALAGVPDPRARRGVRYAFAELLAIVVSAVLSGAQTLTMISEWAEHAAALRPFPGGRTPSVATIHRITASTDAKALDLVVNAWIREQTNQRADRRRVVAIDGKETRGAKNGAGTRVFLMAALDHGTGTVIGQEAIGDKTNEIPHFQTLMRQLGDLDGAVITADALHTQREHATWLRIHGAHYVFTVKNNQRALKDRISQQNWAQLPVAHSRREKKHGRTTTWGATAQPAQKWIDFPGAAQTLRLTRDRRDHTTGESTREHVFIITSLRPDQADPAELASYVRGHWGIENRLHWVRDVTYDEDRSQVRTGNAAHVMASIRNLAISIHRLTGATNIAKALRTAMRNPEIARQFTGL
jgi:predicted transposase YbfD/YdcC